MLTIVTLIVVGVFAGAVNTIAGGGSLLTLPLLMALGLSASAANGTNRIGVLAQSCVATVVFTRHDQVDWRGVIRLMKPVVLGALMGTQISIELPEHMMRGSIIAVMVLVLLSLWMNPKRWLAKRKRVRRELSRGVWVALFVVGAYAGFLQAGAGILFLMVLVWGVGRDLVGANGLKAVLVTLLTLPALCLFATQGLVHWEEGLYLAFGQVIGGVVGARLTVSWGPAFVRFVLLGVVVVSVFSLVFVRGF